MLYDWLLAHLAVHICNFCSGEYTDLTFSNLYFVQYQPILGIA